MTGAWRIEVDPDRCAGSGLCAGIAPAFFAVAGGRSRPSAAPVEPDDDVLAAAECCPMEAIRIRHAADGAPVYGAS